MTWLLRRNLDHALSASHTIEIMFNLPAEFAAGGVASVPGSANGYRPRRAFWPDGRPPLPAAVGR